MNPRRFATSLTLITFGLAVVTRWAGGASAYPLASAACNRPASDMPPAPDGCPDYVPIAPPPAPIPPPCITALRTEWRRPEVPPESIEGLVEGTDWGWGQGVALHIYVDHPELDPGAETYTKLARLVRPGEAWELVDADWEVSCGKDEGPLVWALFEVLNAGRWDALSIYTSPLPAEYMAVLTRLASLRNFTYLPYLEVQP